MDQFLLEFTVPMFSFCATRVLLEYIYEFQLHPSFEKRAKGERIASEFLYILN